MQSFLQNLRIYSPLFSRLFSQFCDWSSLASALALRIPQLVIQQIPLFLGRESDWRCKGRFFDVNEHFGFDTLFIYRDRHLRDVCMCACVCMCSYRCLAVTRSGTRDHWLDGSSRAMLLSRCMCVCIIWCLLILMRTWVSGKWEFLNELPTAIWINGCVLERTQICAYVCVCV